MKKTIIVGLIIGALALMTTQGMTNEAFAINPLTAASSINYDQL